MKNSNYSFKFHIGQTVFLRTDPEQLERIVTGISVRPSGISYVLANKVDESYHYDFEITGDRDVIKTFSS